MPTHAGMTSVTSRHPGAGRGPSEMLRPRMDTGLRRHDLNNVLVTPAQAGAIRMLRRDWMPAYAGMTSRNGYRPTPARRQSSL